MYVGENAFMKYEVNYVAVRVPIRLSYRFYVICTPLFGNLF